MQRTTAIAAAAQMTAGADLTANLDTCAAIARDVAERGAQLLILPENFAFLGRSERQRFPFAEVLDPSRPGPILAAVRQMATEHRLWVLGGGMPEVVSDEGGEPSRTYNTAVLVSPEGRLVATYRKIHLFDVDIPGGAQFRESETTAPGREVVVAETPLGRLGLSICYDLRFPELYRELIRHGAEIIAVPAAFTAHTGKAHWHVLLRARAIENQCYVIAAAQTGRHNDRRESFGHSLIVNPWGVAVAEWSDGTGFALAEIDLDLVAKTRQQMPCREHQVLIPAS